MHVMQTDGALSSNLSWRAPMTRISITPNTGILQATVALSNNLEKRPLTNINQAAATPLQGANITNGA